MSKNFSSRKGSISRRAKKALGKKYWLFKKHKSYLIPDLQKAFAGEKYLHSDILAQSNGTVLCQRNANGFIIVVTQLPGGQCREETIDPYRGTIVSSKFVACYSC